MNVFRELSIAADAKKMAEAVAEIEKSPPKDWGRDKAAEARRRGAGDSAQRPIYYFERRAGSNLPGALLVLAQQAPGTFYVPNIVPTQRHQLEQGEYNAILEDFCKGVLEPVAKQLGFTLQLSPPQAGLEAWMDAETAELLRAFSTNANKGTGASHPRDRERWNAFVVSAQQRPKRLDPSTLERWLIESQGWAPETAEQLALEYESGLRLLDYASGHSAAR